MARHRLTRRKLLRSLDHEWVEPGRLIVEGFTVVWKCPRWVATRRGQPAHVVYAGTLVEVLTRIYHKIHNHVSP